MSVFGKKTDDGTTTVIQIVVGRLTKCMTAVAYILKSARRVDNASFGFKFHLFVQFVARIASNPHNGHYLAYKSPLPHKAYRSSPLLSSSCRL